MTEIPTRDDDAVWKVRRQQGGNAAADHTVAAYEQDVVSGHLRGLTKHNLGQDAEDVTCRGSNVKPEALA